jgi:formate dehydrogenase subunit delta
MESADIIRMTNQIAAFFRGYGHDEAVKEIATHINNFWDPRMRNHLFAYLAKGGARIDPLVIEAAANIRKPKVDAA